MSNYKQLIPAISLLMEAQKTVVKHTIEMDYESEKLKGLRTLLESAFDQWSMIEFDGIETDDDCDKSAFAFNRILKTEHGIFTGDDEYSVFLARAKQLQAAV